ncbi:MAG: LytTR family DNA-binding domain-containing protein [Lachnospiraceae bacterium]|nr:LytTR family DNA-binding domain-containing protein [Lachnospiraceae bacterium]
MDIVICDDDKRDALAARECILQTARELRIKVEFEEYSGAADVERKLMKKREAADILILDIDMPGMSGLELADRLRRENGELLIIFLSNHEEFVFQAIEFAPFRYIRKARLGEEMPLAIRAAAKALKQKEDNQIALHTEGGLRKIQISEILYYEVEKRKIAVHTAGGDCLLAGKTIQEMQALIPKKSFVMLHRGCVVNADYVKNISDSVVSLDNGEKLIVSRQRYPVVKRQILKVWGEVI